MAIIVAKHIHTDTGFVYGVIQTGKGWVAQMYKVSSKVTQRTNIWRMTATGTRADATSVGPEGCQIPTPPKPR